MDGDLGQFLGRFVFDNELADDGNGILIEGGVDVVGCRTRYLYEPRNSGFIRNFIEHGRASQMAPDLASVLPSRVRKRRN